MSIAAIVLGSLLALGSGYIVWTLRRVHGARAPKKQALEASVFVSLPNGQSVQVDPNDPTDPMRDPAVRAMFATVLETGRPMVMNRGEEPRFIDGPDDPDTLVVATGPDKKDVIAVPTKPKS